MNNRAIRKDAGEWKGEIIMKAIVNVCMAVVSMVFYAATVWGATETPDNNFFGGEAGVDITSGFNDTFMGAYAGAADTTGYGNTFMGYYAGTSNTIGDGNTFMGYDAGTGNTTGDSNTFVGNGAGTSNTSGSNNVFLGFFAGYSETGSNKLYIDNCYGGGSCTSPLIYGEFDTRSVTINGLLGITGSANALLSLDTTSTTGGAGFQFSVPTGGLWFFKGTQNNGFKIRDAANGIDVMYFQASTGNVGIGTDSPSHPLELAGGAYSDGTTWNTASSREYKDNIRELSAAEAVAAVKELNPVTYTYKVAAGGQHVGFIAEDVPALVATKDRKGLSSMDIVAVLTKVVQEQQRTLEQKSQLIERQQHKLETLEAKVTKVESEMQRLKNASMTARTVQQ
jgi:hypothetical protein